MTVWKCVLCEENSNQDVYSPEAGTRKNHYRLHHSGHLSGMESSDRTVYAQTFCPMNYTSKTWFEVQPALAQLRALQEDLIDEDDFDNSLENSDKLAQAYLDHWRPAEQPHITVTDLRDVQPFLYYTSWAKHVHGLDTQMLRAMVDVPEKGDALRHLYNAAAKVFRDDQSTIAEQSEVLRLGVMDDGSGCVDSVSSLSLDDTDLNLDRQRRRFNLLRHQQFSITAASGGVGVCLCVDSGSCKSKAIVAIRSNSHPHRNSRWTMLCNTRRAPGINTRPTSSTPSPEHSGVHRTPMTSEGWRIISSAMPPFASPA
jgi:hypothetical protein